MLQIPLSALPNQTVSCTLNNQFTTLHVYQKFWGLFCDVSVNNQIIVQGVMCQNGNYIVVNKYFGFVGDFMFFDTEGTSDPSFEGLANANGGRFFFIYLFPNDLPQSYGFGAFNPFETTNPQYFFTAFPLTVADFTGKGGAPILLNMGSLK